MNEIEIINKFSKQVRKNILDMSLEAGSASAHFGGALSSVEIISALYSVIMKYNKKNYKSESRDRFILSKGHACLVLYSALAEKGIISKSELKTFEKNNSNLLGHPVINRNLGIEFSNGSLGMGLSLGIGVAISLKKKKNDSKVYVLIGDGECNEGSIWEAAMFASSLKINNICAIIDNNGFQQTGTNNQILDIGDLTAKWKSFGWETLVIDGHNVTQILNSLKTKSDKPKVIIAKTIKGKGFSFSENNNEWHHKIMTKQNYMNALKELKHNEN
tara:strand:- start:29750 stop:30571 length:822 start_codon:yes stop_codon:yes gene_type:complete